MPGPLDGIAVVEMGGIGPGPFCAMMLADMGAQVIRVDRKGEKPVGGDGAENVLLRGRRSIAVDLKKPGAAQIVLRLLDKSHVLIEGYRPGVMERLGLGPDACFERNPALVYGRMTGWGQVGPLSLAAGHDINYIALSGALHAMGPADSPPTPPLNLVGDFGGGGMLLAFGIACALVEARHSGKGQVIDAAMADGAALLMAMYYGYLVTGRWRDARGGNFLDGSAHFYTTYACADGKWLAVGAIEPNFYRNLLATCGIDDPDFEAQWDRSRWPALRAKLGAVFLTRSRDEWCRLFEGTDSCVSPVLDLREAPRHPDNLGRRAFVDIAGITQPAPAPRFSRTAPGTPAQPPRIGDHTRAILDELGYGEGDVEQLRRTGAI